MRPTFEERINAITRRMTPGTGSGRNEQVGPVLQRTSRLAPYRPSTGSGGGSGGVVVDFTGPLVTGQRSDILAFVAATSFSQIAAALTFTGSSDTTVTPIHSGTSLTPFTVSHSSTVTIVTFVLSVAAGDTLQFSISTAGASASGLVLAAA